MAVHKSTLRLHQAGRDGDLKLFFFLTVKEIIVCLITNKNDLVERIKLIIQKK